MSVDSLECIEVFYSYAQKDEILCEELQNHLGAMKRLNLIKDWHRREIQVGTDWQQAVDVHLDRAHIILLLISSDFLASDYCYSMEMQQALERYKQGKAQVIPILLRPVDLKGTPIALLRALPANGEPVTNWANRDAAFANISEGIRNVIQELKAAAATIPSFPAPVGLSLSRNSERKSSSTFSLYQQNRGRMLRRLSRSYSESMQRPLQGATLLELELANQPAAVRNITAHLTRLSNQEEEPLPPGTSILQAYDAAAHELLILGAPGAGKSTLLLELAQQLVQRAEVDQAHPLPVILPLSSWAVKRPPLLGDWIVEQLTQFYDIPKHLSERWVPANILLPLLDGLDEMDEEARPACINAINDYHREHLAVPLVVCSRMSDYNNAAESHLLRLQNAVIVQPLVQEQIENYLVRAGESFEALLRVFGKNQALQKLTTTPLMLHVLMLTYQGTSVQDLPQKEAVLQVQVWDDYFRRMVERKGHNERYPVARTRFLLSWLACQMHKHNQTIFYLEQMQPDWLPATQAYERYAVRLPSILIGVLLSLLVNALIPNSFDPVRFITYGFIGGHLGNLLRAQIGKQTANRQVRLIRGIVVSLITSILIGLGIWVCIWFTIGHTYEIKDVLHNGGVAGLDSAVSSLLLSMFFKHFQRGLKRLVVALLRMIVVIKQGMIQKSTSLLSRSPWMRMIILKVATTKRSKSPSLQTDSKSDHGGTWRRRIWNGLLAGFSVGLTFGLLTWQFFTRVHGADYGAIFGIRDGVTYGLTFVLIGVLLSIIFESMNEEIHPTEILNWSLPSLWRSLWSGRHLRQTLFFALSLGGGIGVASSLSTFFSEWLSQHNLATEVKPAIIFGTGLGDGLTYGLTFGVAYWLLLGLYRGLSSEYLPEEGRIKPNEGIWRSLDNSVRTGFYGGLTIGLIGLLSTMFYFGLHAGFGQGPNLGWGQGWYAGFNSFLNTFSIFNIWPSIGLVVGLQAVLFGSILAFMLMGGLACFRHLVLRLLLWQDHKIPFNYPGFLDSAAECILLSKVGGGYKFIHREFQDHLASLLAEYCFCGYQDDRHRGRFCPSCGKKCAMPDEIRIC